MALLVAVAVAVSGCGGSHRVSLPAPLLKLVHSSSKDSHVTGRTVEVYGPGSRIAFVQAFSGDVVGESAVERSGCYLIVFHGHFEGGSSAGGSGTQPHYTIEADVWTPDNGVLDTGVSHGLAAAVSRLRGPTVVALKR